MSVRIIPVESIVLLVILVVAVMISYIYYSSLECPSIFPKITFLLFLPNCFISFMNCKFSSRVHCCFLFFDSRQRSLYALSERVELVEYLNIDSTTAFQVFTKSRYKLYEP